MGGWGRVPFSRNFKWMSIHCASRKHCILIHSEALNTHLGSIMYASILKHLLLISPDLMPSLLQRGGLCPRTCLCWSKALTTDPDRTHYCSSFTIHEICSDQYMRCVVINMKSEINTCVHKCIRYILYMHIYMYIHIYIHICDQYMRCIVSQMSCFTDVLWSNALTHVVRLTTTARCIVCNHMYCV